MKNNGCDVIATSINPKGENPTILKNKGIKVVGCDVSKDRDSKIRLRLRGMKIHHEIGSNRRCFYTSVFDKNIAQQTGVQSLDLRIPVKDEDIDKLIEEVEDHLGRI